MTDQMERIATFNRSYIDVSQNLIDEIQKDVGHNVLFMLNKADQAYFGAKYMAVCMHDAEDMETDR